MASTLQAPSFARVNLRERTALDADAAAGASSIIVESNAGCAAGDIVYVGQQGQERCERAVLGAPSGNTTLALTAPLKHAHSRFENVQKVLGDRLRIYRAVNVDNKPPADESFSVLASRAIKPDNPTTYYTDSTGSSDYWYKLTYWNETTDEETDLADAVPVRGDDYGHYAPLGDIRSKAGFNNATNLEDWVIDTSRRAAETEINGTLSSVYTVPFNPVPEEVKTLTVELAATLLLVDAYGMTLANEKRLKAARAAVQSYADRKATIVDDDGNSIATGGSVSSWPDSNEPRSFRIGDVF